MATLRVLVIGYNAFDSIFPFYDLPGQDCKHEVSAIHMGGGGPGATAAIAMAKLGASVTLVTPLCDDVPGQIQETELLAAGVDLNFSPRFPGALSPKAVIMVNPQKEERTIFWSRGNLPNIEPACVDPAWLDDFDMLYTDGHETLAATKLAKTARAKNLPVIMDAGSVRPGSRELVAHCTDVISSQSFAPALTARDTFPEALHALSALGPSRVGLTLGAGGVLGLQDGKPFLRKAFEVPVLDTTGAGDVFHAGYAYALGVGQSYVEALDFGNATAALKCRGWGGRRELPTLDEVNHLLDHGTRKDTPSALGL